ncbi:hypothetical protein AMTRI_Chr13g89540 [Amborella trichopoda]
MLACIGEGMVQPLVWLQQNVWVHDFPFAAVTTTQIFSFAAIVHLLPFTCRCVWFDCDLCAPFACALNHQMCGTPLIRLPTIVIAQPHAVTTHAIDSTCLTLSLKPLLLYKKDIILLIWGNSRLSHFSTYATIIVLTAP